MESEYRDSENVLVDFYRLNLTKSTSFEIHAYQNAMRDEHDKDGGRQPGTRNQVVSHGHAVDE